MKHVTNGGLELALLNMLAETQTLTDESLRTKKFLESLPANRKEFTIDEYDYYLDVNKRILYRSKVKEMKLEIVPNDKPIIQMSIKNKTGGYIHVDIDGVQHWDLYCEHKSDYFFINKIPY